MIRIYKSKIAPVANIKQAGYGSLFIIKPDLDGPLPFFLFVKIHDADRVSGVLFPNLSVG